jgi:RNA polymerase primary sigma factor
MKQLKITTKITSRDSASIDKYLNEIAKLPLLAENEEVELAKRIREGDQEALDKLTKANLRFVVSVAKQYQNQGLSLNDLINEGNLGLIKAATKFDETKGFKFISYAVWWIRQSILQALIEQPRIVRLPMNKATFYNKLNKVVGEFEQKHQREPSNEELAEILEIKKEELTYLRGSLAFHVSTDAPVSNDDDSKTTAVDLMFDETVGNPEGELLDQSLKIELGRALSTLSDREMQIISYYYGLNKHRQNYSLDEIGNMLGLTRERVRQLKDKSLRKMRRTTCSHALRTYLQ